MLSPIEIKKQEFSRSMRGFDATEVRSFLETVADEFERMIAEIRRLESEAQKQQVELTSYQRIDQNMKEALVNAQETLRGAREGSQRDADLLKREAEFEAEKIISAAHKKADEIRREVELLEVRRDGFVRKLKSLLRSELELIDLLEDDDFAKPDTTKTTNSNID